MSDRFVLDSSVALRWVFPDEKGHEIARQILKMLLVGDIHVVAPKNMMYEFCATVAHNYRTRKKSVDEALLAIRSFMRLPISYFESQELIERATSLSMDFCKSFYDMYFFSVAESESLTVCTADKRSVRGLGEDFPCKYVLLDDFFKSTWR